MKHPVVTITMEDGGIMKLELYLEIAPDVVDNFLSLVKKEFYDDLIFHRVIEGLMIQGGCPVGNGEGGPGYVIKDRFKQDGAQSGLKHKRDVIPMTRISIPDSAGSQFFIMHKTAPHLGGGYAAFGKPVEGKDVLDRIATTKANAVDKSLEDQKIEAVTVETLGETYPEPEKLSEIEY